MMADSDAKNSNPSKTFPQYIAALAGKQLTFIRPIVLRIHHGEKKNIVMICYVCIYNEHNK